MLFQTMEFVSAFRKTIIEPEKSPFIKGLPSDSILVFQSSFPECSFAALGVFDSSCPLCSSLQKEGSQSF